MLNGSIINERRKQKFVLLLILRGCDAKNKKKMKFIVRVCNFHNILPEQIIKMFIFKRKKKRNEKSLKKWKKRKVSL